MSRKFVVVIEQVKREQHEIELEADHIMEAFDQVRAMTEKRNQTNKFKYYITKINEKESDNE